MKAVKRKEWASDGEDLSDRIKRTKTAASTATPFDAKELDLCIKSLQNVTETADTIDWSSLRKLLENTAHEPHKEWKNTERAADALAKLLSGPSNSNFRSIFKRVLEGGCWESAQKAAAARSSSAKPWVVLVTGLNGIRKTTSIYQPWFKKVLLDALGDSHNLDDLPDGNNSFFRQLDYMIATVANEDFRRLYEVEDLALYSAMKDTIFSRYRKVAEMVGVLLLKAAQKENMNVMAETSGRDIAMFRYVDFFFPEGQYRKLVLHFEINELRFAEQSVDGRMMQEMSDGKAALKAAAAASGSGTKANDAVDAVRRIIHTNAGGPYGSNVLKGVQEASQRVWQEVLKGEDAGKSWFKASIAIEGHDTAPWSVRAIMKDGQPARDAFDFPVRPTS
jgi:hypothetical protein